MVEKVPQAEALAERWVKKSRPICRSVLHTERRRLATVGVAMLAAWLFLHVMFGAMGW